MLNRRKFMRSNVGFLIGLPLIGKVTDSKNKRDIKNKDILKIAERASKKAVLEVHRKALIETANRCARNFNKLGIDAAEVSNIINEYTRIVNKVFDNIEVNETC